jgi:transketolase N-terminal domain/subunit
MLSLSNQYAVPTTETEKYVILSAGQAVLAFYAGTAYDVYSILNGFALLTFSFVLL